MFDTPPLSPWIDLAPHGDSRGQLTVAEGLALPFEIKRLYWLHGFSGAPRGGHAHRTLWQVFVPLAGAVTLTLETARGARSYRLDNPARALLVGPMTWRDLTDFAPETVCLVMASAAYDEADYIRDHAAFRVAARHVTFSPTTA